MDGNNYFNAVKGFIEARVIGLKTSFSDVRDLLKADNTAAFTRCLFEFLANLIVLAAMCAATIFVVYHAYNFISAIWFFLNEPQNKPLKIIATFTLFMLFVALFLSKLQHKNGEELTEKELWEIHESIQGYLCTALQAIAADNGLRVPLDYGDLTTLDEKPFFSRESVYIHKYKCKKSEESERFGAKKCRKETADELRTMEKNGKLGSYSRSGYRYAGRPYCSFLVMDVIEHDTYAEFLISIANDDSCRMFEHDKRFGTPDIPADEDF